MNKSIGFLQRKKNPNEETIRTLCENTINSCTTEMVTDSYEWHSVRGLSSQNGILREFLLTYAPVSFGVLEKFCQFLLHIVNDAHSKWILFFFFFLEKKNYPKVRRNQKVSFFFFNIFHFFPPRALFQLRLACFKLPI